jgi:hypothetical protein
MPLDAITLALFCIKLIKCGIEYSANRSNRLPIVWDK